MKLNPYSFRAHVTHLRLHTVQASVSTRLVCEVDRLFSPLFRELNASDKQFCYSCRCNKFYTVWNFAYSDQLIFDLVIKYIQGFVKGIELQDKSINTKSTFEDYLMQPCLDDECACPFENHET